MWLPVRAPDGPSCWRCFWFRRRRPPARIWSAFSKPWRPARRSPAPTASWFPPPAPCRWRMRSPPAAPSGTYSSPSDIVDTTGYSGKPISILVGVGLDGVIRSVRLVEHHEPIVLIGIPERRVAEVIDGYVGLDLVALDGATSTDRRRGHRERRHRDRHGDRRQHRPRRPGGGPDPGARRHGPALGPGNAASRGGHGPRRGPGLVGSWWQKGRVRRLKLTVGGVNRAFLEGGDPAAIERPEPGSPDDPFMELHARGGLRTRHRPEPARRRRVPQSRADPGPRASRRSCWPAPAGTRSRAPGTSAAASSTASTSCRANVPSGFRDSSAQAPAPGGGEGRAGLRGGGPVPHRRRERFPGRRAVADRAAGEPCDGGRAPRHSAPSPSTTPCRRRTCCRPGRRRSCPRLRLGPAEESRRSGKGSGGRSSARQGCSGSRWRGLTVAFFFQMSLVRRPALAQGVRVGFLLFPCSCWASISTHNSRWSTS